MASVPLNLLFILIGTLMYVDCDPSEYTRRNLDGIIANSRNACDGVAYFFPVLNCILDLSSFYQETSYYT